MFVTFAKNSVTTKKLTILWGRFRLTDLSSKGSSLLPKIPSQKRYTMLFGYLKSRNFNPSIILDLLLSASRRSKPKIHRSVHLENILRKFFKSFYCWICWDVVIGVCLTEKLAQNKYAHSGFLKSKMHAEVESRLHLAENNVLFDWGLNRWVCHLASKFSRAREVCARILLPFLLVHCNLAECLLGQSCLVPCFVGAKRSDEVSGT